MTEEKADQIIRCVKECWWQVLVLLLVGLGLPVALFHGWPTGEWELGWTAVAAIATFFAACVALVLGRSQQNKEQKEKRARALIAASYMEPILRKTSMALSFFSLISDDFELSEQQCSSLSGLWDISRITSTDLADYSALEPRNAEVVAQSISVFENLLNLCGVPAKRANPMEYSVFLRALRKGELMNTVIRVFAASADTMDSYKSNR